LSNADTLHRVFALMDQQDFAAIREHVAPNFGAVFGNTPLGFEEWAGMSGMMYSAFPDGQHTLHETFEVDDRVFVRGNFNGTHRGDFMGTPATGKQVTITFMNFDRFAEGKLVEHRAEADMLGLMQQLGVSSNVAAAAS
jgi:predicted ester cyclase